MDIRRRTGFCPAPRQGNPAHPPLADCGVLWVLRLCCGRLCCGGASLARRWDVCPLGVLRLGHEPMKAWILLALICGLQMYCTARMWMFAPPPCDFREQCWKPR